MRYCPGCDARLPADREGVGARCPSCREPLYEPAGPGTRAAADGEQCAAHPGMAAIGTCSRCGNYLCPVCRTRWQTQALCAACVDRALESGESAPQAAKAGRRQAVLALVFGIAAWAVGGLGVLLAIFAGVLIGIEAGAGCAVVALMLTAFLLMVVSPALSALGIGQGAAAIRTRAGSLILATLGLVLSALHVGAAIGMACFSVWQN